MIEVAIPLCRLDDKPINESRLYQKLIELHGEAYASLFSYDYVVRYGSNELKEAVQIVTGGVAPGNKKGE